MTTETVVGVVLALVPLVAATVWYIATISEAKSSLFAPMAVMVLIMVQGIAIVLSAVGVVAVLVSGLWYLGFLPMILVIAGIVTLRLRQRKV